MKISIRPFEKEDIAKKIEWINDPENNRYLHYDLPLEYEKTLNWFEKNRGRKDRADMVIEADGEPVGLIGLLSIDRKNGKAEYYVSMGEKAMKGQGVAKEASRLILEYAFRELRLDKVYLYTETGNIAAQKLFARVGFQTEGLLKADVVSHGTAADRYALGVTRADWLRNQPQTPVTEAGEFFGNRLFFKRDDLIPYCFGGNKARKAELFFKKIDEGGYDCVVTYGSSHSNHCRIVANMAAKRSLPCTVIAPSEVSEPTFNSRFMELFGAKTVTVPVEEVHETIEKTLEELESAGKKPYFIPGGGHGNLGTEAYVRCYDEIASFEKETRTRFDYIFFASGTGTTQAGLICGKLMSGGAENIVGISIARKNPRGRNVVLESVRDYLSEKGFGCDEAAIEKATVFIDDYIGEGYGAADSRITKTIKRAMTEFGVPLDSTYTAKAFAGMEDYLKTHGVAGSGKNILFIHTGGTPLFFDDMEKINGTERTSE